MSVKLSERLKAAYDMVTEGSVVADVGCDHAFLSIALVSSGKSPEAFACDVNEGPLEKAKEHITAAGLSEKIHPHLSDGLKGLDSPVDSIVICGMGGSLVISILEQSIEKAKSARGLILSPQSDIFKVRSYLRDHGFSLLEERAVTDAGKYYELMKVRPGGALTLWDRYGDFGLKYGPYLIEHRDKTLMDHLKKRQAAIEGIIAGISGENKRKEELQKEADIIAGIYHDKD